MTNPYTPIKEGDVVQLKSGSQPMTVEREGVVDRDCLLCLWMEGNTIFTRAFRPSALEKVWSLDWMGKTVDPPAKGMEKTL